MRKLDLRELRVETFATTLAAPVPGRIPFTEQQYCTIGNPPGNELDRASQTACPQCCV